MGFFSKRRMSRSIDAAHDALAREEADAASVLDTLLRDVEDADRTPALLQLAERLIDDESYDHARAAIERALELEPDSWDALGLLVQVERQIPERRHQAIEALRRLLAADPGNVDVAADLALLLTEQGQAESALEVLRALEDRTHPLVALRTGEALAALGRSAEALESLREVQRLYEYRLKHGMLHGDAYEMREHMTQAARLYAALRTEVPDEQRDVPGERDGTPEKAPLDEADVPALLLARLQDPLVAGLALRAESPRIARDLRLLAPEATIDAAQARLATDPGDVAALALLGSGLLRLGRVAEARERFESALAADPRCFPALLGLGATLAHERHDLFGFASSLPPAPERTDLRAFLPDWEALTNLERAVLWASVEPLRAALGEVTAAASLLLLPIDVRPADLEEAGPTRDAGQGGEPPDASRQILVADAVTLLDTSPDRGWNVGRRFAAFVHDRLPSTVRAQVDGLLRQARERRWPDENAVAAPPSELFATAYALFLGQRHGLLELEELGDAETCHGLMAFFATIAERDSFGGKAGVAHGR